MKDRSLPSTRAVKIVNSYIKRICEASVTRAWAIDMAKEQVNLLLEEIPMYDGLLNDDWRYYNDVLAEIDNIEHLYVKDGKLD